MENMISEESNQEAYSKSSRRIEISKFLFALGFIIFIILLFYPQYQYNPPPESNSSKYWNNYWQNLENFYSGNRANPNQLYPIGEEYSSVGIIKHWIDNGYTGGAFYAICLLMLELLFAISTIFRKKIFYGFYAIGASYALFFFIFSFFNSNPLTTRETLGYVSNIIATLLVLTGFQIDNQKSHNTTQVSQRIMLLKIFLIAIAGILFLLSTSYYFTGSNISTATELTGIYPTIYIISGLVIIIISFLKKDIFMITLGTMLFFLTLTIWFSSSFRSGLKPPGTGMIMMLLGSLIAMFNNVLVERIEPMIKYDFQKIIKGSKDGKLE